MRGRTGTRGLVLTAGILSAGVVALGACSSRDDDPPVLTGCSGAACGGASGGGGGGGSAPLDGGAIDDDAGGFDVQATDAGLVAFDSGLNFNID